MKLILAMLLILPSSVVVKPSNPFDLTLSYDFVKLDSLKKRAELVVVNYKSSAVIDLFLKVDLSSKLINNGTLHNVSAYNLTFSENSKYIFEIIFVKPDDYVTVSYRYVFSDNRSGGRDNIILRPLSTQYQSLVVDSSASYESEIVGFYMDYKRNKANFTLTKNTGSLYLDLSSLQIDSSVFPKFSSANLYFFLQNESSVKVYKLPLSIGFAGNNSFLLQLVHPYYLDQFDNYVQKEDGSYQYLKLPNHVVGKEIKFFVTFEDFYSVGALLDVEFKVKFIKEVLGSCYDDVSFCISKNSDIDDINFQYNNSYDI